MPSKRIKPSLQRCEVNPHLTHRQYSEFGTLIRSYLFSITLYVNRGAPIDRQSDPDAYLSELSTAIANSLSEICELKSDQSNGRQTIASVQKHGPTWKLFKESAQYTLSRLRDQRLGRQTIYSIDPTKIIMNKHLEKISNELSTRCQGRWLEENAEHLKPIPLEKKTSTTAEVNYIEINGHQFYCDSGAIDLDAYAKSYKSYYSQLREDEKLEFETTLSQRIKCSAELLEDLEDSISENKSTKHNNKKAKKKKKKKSQNDSTQALKESDTLETQADDSSNTDSQRERLAQHEQEGRIQALKAFERQQQQQHESDLLSHVFKLFAQGHQESLEQLEQALIDCEKTLSNEDNTSYFDFLSVLQQQVKAKTQIDIADMIADFNHNQPDTLTNTTTQEKIDSLQDTLLQFQTPECREIIRQQQVHRQQVAHDIQQQQHWFNQLFLPTQQIIASINSAVNQSLPGSQLGLIGSSLLENIEGNPCMLSRSTDIDILVLAKSDCRIDTKELRQQLHNSSYDNITLSLGNRKTVVFSSNEPEHSNGKRVINIELTNNLDPHRPIDLTIIQFTDNNDMTIRQYLNANPIISDQFGIDLGVIDLAPKLPSPAMIPDYQKHYLQSIMDFKQPDTHTCTPKAFANYFRNQIKKLLRATVTRIAYHQVFFEMPRQTIYVQRDIRQSNDPKGLIAQKLETELFKLCQVKFQEIELIARYDLLATFFTVLPIIAVNDDPLLIETQRILDFCLKHTQSNQLILLHMQSFNSALPADMNRLSYEEIGVLTHQFLILYHTIMVSNLHPNAFHQHLLRQILSRIQPLPITHDVLDALRHKVGLFDYPTIPSARETQVPTPTPAGLNLTNT